MRVLIDRGLPVLGLLALLLGSRLVALRFGEGARNAILAGLVGLYVLVALALWLIRRQLRRAIRSLPPEQQLELARGDPIIRDVVAGDMLGGERRDWTWRVNSVLGGIAALFYLPFLYTLATEGAVTPDSPFTGVHLLLMVGGVGIFCLVQRYRVRHYRCPMCHAVPVRVSREPARYYCDRCRSTWNLGGSGFGD
jgi:hypothetical protein